MQLMAGSANREHRAAPEVRAGLDVWMFAVNRSEGRSALRMGARGGVSPLRLHLYVDGDLVESWPTAPASVTFEIGGLSPGRHAVTLRAFDATGRWGGSSLLVGGGRSESA